MQKWVTLQPNSDYNRQESCLSKTQLDMRAIAREIVAELSSAGSSGAGQPRRLVTAGPTSRNSLLQSSRPARLNQASSTRTSGSDRVRKNFSFPQEVAENVRSQGGSRRSGNGNNNLRNQRPLRPLPRQRDNRNRRNQNRKTQPRPSSAPSASLSEQVLVDRLSGKQQKPRFGVSTHACLFKLCPL